MNKKYIYIIITVLCIFLLVWWIGLISKDAQHSNSNLNTKNVILSPEIKSIRPQIIEAWVFVMNDQIWANQESTIQIREEYMKTPYQIYEYQWNNEVRVYLPVFFHQSIKQQNEFSEKIRKLDKYNLDLNIFTFSYFEKDKIRRFFSVLQPKFSSVTFRFYDIPVNYYDIISEFSFNMAWKDMNIELYGQMFPDGFMIDSMIVHIKNMLKYTLNQWDLLNSMNFSSEEGGNIFFLLTDDGIKNLLNISTIKLSTERILINWLPEWPGEILRWKKKIEQFFKNSTIQDIQMQSVWEKKDWVVNLYWF